MKNCTRRMAEWQERLITKKPWSRNERSTRRSHGQEMGGQHEEAMVKKWEVNTKKPWSRNGRSTLRVVNLSKRSRNGRKKNLFREMAVATFHGPCAGYHVGVHFRFRLQG